MPHSTTHAATLPISNDDRAAESFPVVGNKEQSRPLDDPLGHKSKFKPITYLICSAPRTGSTLLGDSMMATGVAGRPAEYFDIHPENETFWSTRLGIAHPSEYLDTVIAEATTSNGVCGLKLHWHQCESLRLKLAAGLNAQDNGRTLPPLADLITQKFGPPAYLWVKRQNKVAQGISYYLASKTGVWRLFKQQQTPQLGDVKFDFPEIRRFVQLCEDFDQRWEAYFRTHHLNPLIVVYERFIEAYEATIRGILDFLGLPALDASYSRPQLERQADLRSFEWEERYRSIVRRDNGRAALAPAVKAQSGASSLNRLHRPRAPLKAGASYLICTAPRTGSTLLADALASTGVAGIPDEYFALNGLHDRDYWMQRRFGTTGESRLIDRIIQEGTTENGVFGAKVFWGHRKTLRHVLLMAAGLAADSEEPPLEMLLRDAFRSPRYIWLRRRNFVAQAISRYRAENTGVWRAVPGRGDQNGAMDASLGFDYEKIDLLVERVQDHDWRWGQFFTQSRLTPLMIFYEDLVSNYDTTIKGVLQFLQIWRAGTHVARPRTERQADDRSLEWERQYIQIKAEQQDNLGQSVSSEEAARARLSPPTTAVPCLPSSDIAREGGGEAPLSFIAYRTTTPVPAARMRLIVAPRTRAWMDATPRRFAYRCLPMLIANQAGWLMLNAHKLTATWSGEQGLDALNIKYAEEGAPKQAQSHFGAGILTFTIPYLFRTPEGFNLHVRGPANSPKDSICALEGIVETDWSEATFTMNWKFTRPNSAVTFEIGEPIAMITPVRRGELELFQPAVRDLSEDRDLEAAYREWCKSRSAFNAALNVEGSAARKMEWQRDYMRGTSTRGDHNDKHQTSLKLNRFETR